MLFLICQNEWSDLAKMFLATAPPAVASIPEANIYTSFVLLAA
jgi:hypothetical protein